MSVFSSQFFTSLWRAWCCLSKDNKVEAMVRLYDNLDDAQKEDFLAYTGKL